MPVNAAPETRDDLEGAVTDARIPYQQRRRAD